MTRRVVITGIGTLCSLGTSTEEVWQNCLQGNASVAPIPEHWHQYSRFKSKIWSPLPTIDFAARGIPRVEVLRTDPVSLLAYLAAVEAIENAHLSLTTNTEKAHAYNIEGIDPNRTAIMMGTAVGGVSSLLENYAHILLAKPSELIRESIQMQETNTLDLPQHQQITDLLDRWRYPARFNTFVIPMLMPNAVSAYLGIKLSISGINNTIALACASGAAAIGQAYQLITTGQVDNALCGGSEYLNDYYGGAFRGFDVAGTLVQNDQDPSRANRPFDKDRSGFLFSEGGACVLVLEEYQHAIARKAPIVAELCGYAQTFDAHSIMRPAPDGVQATQMIDTALSSAQLTNADVDYINTHGTGTNANDVMEAQIIRDYFEKQPLVNSTKSLSGHAIGASGAIEAAITALSIHHQTTHACKNLDAPIADLNFVHAVKQQKIAVALTQSFAFGGHNVALVMKKPS